jgi:hypothetical protein
MLVTSLVVSILIFQMPHKFISNSLVLLKILFILNFLLFLIQIIKTKIRRIIINANTFILEIKEN